jgi:FkbM family methyltransferase
MARRSRFGGNDEPVASAIIVKMLVFDVGMHNGNDTAYYLSLGHQVVAVEANPALCDLACTRFSAELTAGRLVLEQVAIAPMTGETPFYVTVGKNEWSSLDRIMASRSGHATTEVTVQAAPMSDLFCRHGISYYLKIDIERGDWVCLDALDPMEDDSPGR